MYFLQRTMPDLSQLVIKTGEIEKVSYLTETDLHIDMDSGDSVRAGSFILAIG
ncbi:hypothetical protein [Terribacillus saccharophilus]|uniref:hypothetical protein n=1 Tax=Terribacillus saccharophilus TaxID=361277 RepID=UPI001595679E|nr:hypothetical protein [Terribacillus saccharophilus]